MKHLQRQRLLLLHHQQAYQMEEAVDLLLVEGVGQERMVGGVRIPEKQNVEKKAKNTTAKYRLPSHYRLRIGLELDAVPSAVGG